jgi:hypothetical protein
MTNRRERREQGEWGIAVVILGALFGIFVLVAFYFVSINHLDEVVWERSARTTASQPGNPSRSAMTAER